MEISSNDLTQLKFGREAYNRGNRSLTDAGAAYK